MRHFREKVDITSVLKNIIDNYPAGSAVLRELLQNSDDARASSQTFILDKRSHSDDELPDDALAACQGPALLAINDSIFQEKDWKAITSIHDSSKVADETQTGKYGLGFRSCYHVTDNPQVLSTTCLLVLDPHEEFGDYAGGLQLEASDGDLTRFPNLYQPFNIPEIIPNLENYRGTAIRLPLRSASRAKQSRIKTGGDAEVTPAKVEEWFNQFVETELPVAMLFLKHVAKIELWIIDDEDEDEGVHVTVASSSIVQKRGDKVLAKRSLNRGRTPEKSHYILEIDTFKGNESPKRTEWVITQFVRDNGEVEKDLGQVLNRPRSKVAEQMKKDKLLPHLALAFPLATAHQGSLAGFEGRLFSLLPLPIVTDFPLHIHAIFALLSSRQNLRNSQENVRKDSRERLLVEWNRLIFNTILPLAWSYLLRELPHISPKIDIYSAWPQVTASEKGDVGYWANLPGLLLDQTARHPVWPVIGGNELLQLKDLLVVSFEEADDLVVSLQSAGLRLTRPPQHIFELISKSSTKPTPHGQIMSPASICLALEAHIPTVRKLSGQMKDTIAEYLATANQISLFKNIPVVQAVSGTYVPVDPKNAILASQHEADLFKEINPDMLARETMQPTTKALMDNGVRSLDVATIVQHLKSFSARNPTSGHVADGTLGWVCRFWAFVSSWAKGPDLLNKILEFDLIPTLDSTLRRLSARVLPLTEDSDPELPNILKRFSVPILHPNMSDVSRVFLQDHGIVAVQHDMGFLMDAIEPDTPPNLERSITQQHKRIMHDYLRLQLPSYKKPLEKHQILKLLKLPVFPVIPAGDNRGSRGGTPSLGTVGSTYYFIDSSVLVIPKLKDVTFIDAKTCPELVNAVRHGDDVKNEVDILQLVLEHTEQWPQQPEQVYEGLLDRFFKRISDLPPHSRDRLKKLPFVNVGAGRVRPPCEIVDPESRIAKLFTPGDQVLPVGRFNHRGADAILTQLRTRDFLQTELSTTIIDERLRNMDRGSTLELLKVVDEHCVSHSPVLDTFLPQTIFSTHWVPGPGSGVLHFVRECRDRQAPENLLLYDLVLPVVDYEVKSPELRGFLGWDSIPTETIVEQMMKAIPVYKPSEKRSKSRVTTLINELADRLHKQVCSLSELERLQAFLHGRPWIPMDDSMLELSERCLVDAIDLGPLSRLWRLPRSLRGDQKVVAFLEQFGVCQRPSVAVLLSELEYLKEHDNPLLVVDNLVRSSIAVLRELSTRDDITTEERARIWVPITMEGQTSSVFQNISSVCYDNDPSDDGHGPPPTMYFTHPAISPELAERLYIDRLSDLEFEVVQGDEFESFNVGEDLTRRVQNVLKAYSEDASSNEWVANADDAGASTVSLICNERHLKIRRAPSPSLGQYFEGPSLIVHNSAMFSERDFEGLKKIGLGGKSDRPDSIGRFGLGVLSLYHFGDVMMLVSGTSVIFLDPAREHLPRELGGGKRSGIKTTIRECRRLFPDMLLAIDRVEGFKASEDTYEGTIFLVPLRSDAHRLTSKVSKVSISVSSLIDRLRGAWLRNAKKSLFFTSLSSISASHRLPSGVADLMWTIDATRREEKAKEGMRRQHLKLTGSALPEGSEWLVLYQTENLPSNFKSLAAKYELPPEITTAVAVQISPSPSAQPSGLPYTRTSHSLFATLPLPFVTKINAHIHSQLVMSDNRRDLHFDPSSRSHMDSDTAFNTWVISTLIPPLLLHTIAALSVDKDSRAAARRLWPDKACSDASSDLDGLLTRSLYQILPRSQEQLFETFSGHMVSPSNVVLGISGNQPVEDLLEKLCPDTFARSPLDWSFIASTPTVRLTSIKTDSPTFIRSVLQSHAPRLLKDSLMDNVDLDGLIQYLLGNNESLVGLPLLRLKNGELSCFTGRHDSQDPIFPYNDAINSIFDTNRMVVKEGPGSLGAGTLEAIIKQDKVNLVRLDAKGMKSLLTNSEWVVKQRSPKSAEQAGVDIQWIRGFWDGCLKEKFGAKITPDDLADLSLFPTVGGPPISLSSCSEQVTFWRQQEDWDQQAKEILPTLLTLGIRVIDMEYSPFKWEIRRSYSKLSSTLTVALVLEFLSSQKDTWLDKEALGKVSQESLSQLATWIRSVDIPTVQNLLLTHPNITNLPLWEARRISPDPGPVKLKALKDIVMLPRHASLSLIAKFMDGGEMWFCEHLSEYSQVLQKLFPSGHVLDPKGLLQKLKIVPQRLTIEEVPDFLDLLRMLKTLEAPAPNNPFIPNGDLVLCHPRDIFPAGNPLFAVAFQYQPTRLVSKMFLELGEWFGTLGVPKDVTSESFIAAATAIDEFIRQRQDTIIEAAGIEVAFSHLDEHPWMFDSSMSGNAFQRIRGLRCIVRRPERSSDNKLEELAPFLPQVLALNNLVLEEHQSSAWTQRARFSTEPSKLLKAVFPEMGVPDVGEVVAHLVVLANAIQRNPDLGPLLTPDLEKTYRWLNQHGEGATKDLQKWKDERLFWNVNKDSDDMGTWHSATMMWLNITLDDPEKEQYSVKTFMGQFGALLKVAGVREFPVLEYKGTATSSTEYFERAHSNLNRFCGAENKLTDVVLFPRGYPRSGEGLRAHRSVLAASSSYFEDLFAGGRHEEILGSRLIHFKSYKEPKDARKAKRIQEPRPLPHVEIAVPNYSFEEVESALYHIYTANFRAPYDTENPRIKGENPAIPVSTGKSSEMLATLVNLLHLSHTWSLNELKLHTEEFIRQSGLIMPSTLRYLIEECEKAEAHDLLRYCMAIKEEAQKKGWRADEL